MTIPAKPFAAPPCAAPDYAVDFRGAGGAKVRAAEKLRAFAELVNG